MNDQEVAVVHLGQGEMAQVAESAAVKPADIIEKAQEMAKILTRIVQSAKLSKRFGNSNKEYLQFEAWQTIGRFHNCTPITEWTRAIKQDGYEGNWGWECRVNIINMDGQLIGSAEGMCCRDEDNWKKRNDYALRSMAQTRTASKALRSCFAWVAVLAGYESTPAEEMRDEYAGGKKKEEKPPFVAITPDQKGKIVEMFKAQGYEKREATALYKEHLGGKPSKGKATAFIDNFYVLIPEHEEPGDSSDTPSGGADIKKEVAWLQLVVQTEDFTLDNFRAARDLYQKTGLEWKPKWDELVQSKEFYTILPQMYEAIKEAVDG